MTDGKTAAELLDLFRKYARFCDEGRVTPDEFTAKFFDQFAYLDGVLPEIIPEMWEGVPRAARETFAESLRAATRPDFRRRPWKYGGRRPPTEEENRRDADRQTNRVKAWASAFVRHIDGR